MNGVEYSVMIFFVVPFIAQSTRTPPFTSVFFLHGNIYPFLAGFLGRPSLTGNRKNRG